MTRGVSPKPSARLARRARLSPRERAAILERQGGLCVVWGCTESKGLQEEHSTPVALGGDAKPDQLMCKRHHDAKTFGLRGDVSSIAKAKRIREGRTQYDKRKLKGSRIKSRGFDKTRSKKLDGTVVVRNG